MDIRQSPQYAKFMEQIGWKVEKVGGTNFFIKPLPLFSFLSVIKIQRFKSLDQHSIETVAKKHQALFVKLEPDVEGTSKNNSLPVSADLWPLLPTKTLVLDLKKLHFPSSVTRAKKFTLRTVVSRDIETFITSWEQNAKARKFWAPLGKDIRSLYDAFGKESFVFLTYDNDLLVSGIFATGYKKVAHYFYAFSTPRGRDKWAAYKCLGDAVKILRQKGYQFLDFEGVFDERYPKLRNDWKGFTDFKQRWGGKNVYYPPSFVWYRNPLIKLLFLLEKFSV